MGSITPVVLPSPATSSFSLMSETQLPCSPPVLLSHLPTCFCEVRYAPSSESSHAYLPLLHADCWLSSRSRPQPPALLPVSSHVMSVTTCLGVTQSLSWRNGLRLSSCPQAPLFPRLRASPPHVSLSQFPVSGNAALPTSRFVISDSSLSNVKDGSTMKTSASSGNSLLSAPPSTSSSF